MTWIYEAIHNIIETTGCRMWQLQYSLFKISRPIYLVLSSYQYANILSHLDFTPNLLQTNSHVRENYSMCMYKSASCYLSVTFKTRQQHIMRRYILLGRNNRWLVHGCERITTAKRWKTHHWDLQYGFRPSGSSISLHNSSSSWRDSQTTYWNTHWTLCCRSVTLWQ